MNDTERHSRPSGMFSLTRWLFALAGLLLLVTVIPHADPWRMKHVVRVINPPLFIDFFPLGLSWSFRLSELAVIGLLLVAFALPFVAIPAFRQALTSLKRNKPLLFGAILSSEFFVFTLIAVSNDIIHDYKSVFLFLSLGSLGILYLSIGLSPWVRKLFRKAAFEEFVTKSYDRVRLLLFESPRKRFLLALFLLELTLTIIISFTVFEAIPHVQDSVAQYFQGKIFASGHLTVSSPPQKEFFDYLHMINNGRWYSQYPPGHPVILMLGILAGVPWAINPLFGSLCILLLFFLGTELYDERTGRLAALLGLLSPFLLFMSSEYMNHTTAMFFFLSFALFLVRSIRTGRISSAVIAGASLGMVAAIRPYSAAFLGLLFALYALYEIIRRPKELWRTAVGFTVAIGAVGGLLLMYNYLTNGDPLLFGFEVLYGPNVRPGFGHAAWGVPHNAFRGLLQTMNNLNGMNKHLFEWPAPSLLLVFLLFVSGSRNKWDYILIGTFAAVVIAYFFYWFQDLCFGPRFLYEPAAALILLTARGILRLPEVVRGAFGFDVSVKRIRVATMGFMAILFGLGFWANIPPHLRHYGNSYWDVNRDVLNTLEAKGITRGLILTRTNFGGVLPANSPMLKGELIFARDFGEKDSALVKLFPQYTPYIAVGTDIQPYVPPSRE